VGAHTHIENSRLDNTIIQEDSRVINAELTNSMIGNKALFNGKHKSVSIGDYSQVE
jgi:glucose-1-phosphate thymidylyltransferase